MQQLFRPDTHGITLLFAKNLKPKNDQVVNLNWLIGQRECVCVGLSVALLFVFHAKIRPVRLSEGPKGVNISISRNNTLSMICLMPNL